MVLDWKYEKQVPPDDSVQKRRVLFFDIIQRWRPRVVTNLFNNAFPDFVTFIANRFRQYFPYPPLEAASWQESFGRMKCIPELEMRFIDWAALKGWEEIPCMEGSEQIRSRLEEWGTENNLNRDWCYDFAIRAMRSWIFNDNIGWTFGPDNLPEMSLESLAWSEAIAEMEFDLLYERISLSLEVFGGDPPEFTFGTWFKHSGFNWLAESKKQWENELKRQFVLAVRKLAAKGQRPSGATLTSLRKAISAYIKHGEHERLRAIERYQLSKCARSYAEGHTREDHVLWLTLYQVPPCLSYSQIANSFNGVKELARTRFEATASMVEATPSMIDKETVRKCVEAAASMVDLKLRNPRLHAGRPRGSYTTKDIHRTAYKEETLSPKNPDK